MHPPVANILPLGEVIQEQLLHEIVLLLKPLLSGKPNEPVTVQGAPPAKISPPPLSSLASPVNAEGGDQGVDSPQPGEVILVAEAPEDLHMKRQWSSTSARRKSNGSRRRSAESAQRPASSWS